MFLNGFITGQDCNYLVNTIDPFTKTKILETYPVIVYNLYKRLDLRFIRRGMNTYLYANLTFPSSDVVFIEGNQAILLFTDESTHILNLSSESGKTISAGKTHNFSGTIYSEFGLYYHFSEKDKKLVKGKEIAAIRFYAADNYVEIPVAKSSVQFGGLGKRKKEIALRDFFITDIECIF